MINFSIISLRPGGELIEVSLALPRGPERPGGEALCYVGKIARHWRVTAWASGPALEGMERYHSREEATEAAKSWLRAQEASWRLGGPIS